MNILMFVEQLEHLAGMENIALQMGNFLSSKGHTVYYGVTYGNNPRDNHIIQMHECQLQEIIEAFDVNVVINHCDWNYRILWAIERLSLDVQTYTICHSDFWSCLSQPSTPNNDLLPLYWKLKKKMKIIAISDNDFINFNDIGFQTYLWKFGTDLAHSKFNRKCKTYSKVLFVSARWSVPKKNLSYAKALFNSLKTRNINVDFVGRDWDGIDAYESDIDKIYQQGNIIILPSFRETRPLTTISAYKSHCPVFCLGKWTGLPNELSLSGDLIEDTNAIQRLVGTKVKRYKPLKQLSLSYSMSQFLNIISSPKDLPQRINCSSNAYLACRSRIEYIKNVESSNLIIDYRNNWVPQLKTIVLIADGFGMTNWLRLSENCTMIIMYRNSMLKNRLDIRKEVSRYNPTYIGIIENNKFLVGNDIGRYYTRIAGYDMINIQGVARFYLSDRFIFDDEYRNQIGYTTYGNPSVLRLKPGEV